MSPEQIRKREEELNAKCVKCRQQNGIPSFDHCNYYCTIGAQLHKLDFEKQNGWGNHSYWQK